jgi:signal transduction histidine kinase
MRERAALLGGELTIDSTPGAGTHIVAELPLRSQGQAQRA